MALVCAQAENRVNLSENPPFLTGLGWFNRSSQDRRRNQAATWFRFFLCKDKIFDIKPFGGSYSVENSDMHVATVWQMHKVLTLPIDSTRGRSAATRPCHGIS